MRVCVAKKIFTKYFKIKGRTDIITFIQSQKRVRYCRRDVHTSSTCEIYKYCHDGPGKYAWSINDSYLACKYGGPGKLQKSWN